MLGIPVDVSISESSSKEDYLRHAGETSEKIKQQFPKARVVANTFRFDKGPSGIQYYTTVWADKKLYHSTEYFSGKIVDKVGSGDCYMAGLIYGMYNDLPLQQTLEFATAAAFQKLFITSDATDQKVEAIQKFMQTYER